MLTQRLGSTTQLDPRFMEEFIRIVREHPGSCDEVWLATKYGFPPLSVHRKTAETLAETAKRLREAGLRVSLQISNTVGHGEYMSSQDCSGLVYDGSPVRNMVGPDGTVARYCFCWNDPVMRKYVAEEVRAYAEAIRPHTVWVDDDLRAVNHAPVHFGCFCPSCVAAFNRKNGTAFSREDLAEEVGSGESGIREAWVKFVRDGLYSFTSDLCRAVAEVSPETFMGLQNGSNGGYTGGDLGFIFDAMRDASGKPPKYRPGGGAYNDHDPNSMLWKMDTISWQNARLPKYVTEIRPEIENLPDVRYGKTIPGTCYETTLYLAAGATAMSYAMLMNANEGMDWHGDMLAVFAAHRPYWELLARASEGTCQGGLKRALGAEMWKRKLESWEEPFAWCGEPAEIPGEELRGTGIPLSFDCAYKPVYILNPDAIRCMTDGEIETLLGEPVVTSGESLIRLAERGFGSMLGAEAHRISTLRLYERYSGHPVNGQTKGKTWDQSFHVSSGHALCDLDGTTEILGTFETANSLTPPLFPDGPHPFGIASAVVHTAKGARWAVFGDSPWNSVISLDRRNQILRAADMISGNRLPAILETGVRAVLLPREDPEGRLTSVSVLNCTVGESGPLVLRLRRPALEPGQKTAVFGAQYQPILRDLPITRDITLDVTRDGEDYIAVMPSLRPWSIGTIFLRTP
ncbi:MAG: hypothetical protein II953_03040 [Clostridia bacterium]|nr:hypothetical protein [Clostridia bacterium]